MVSVIAFPSVGIIKVCAEKEVSTLKEELAASNSTISHLNSIEVKFSELQQTCSNQLGYIASNKAEISKLSTQVDEKTLQLQRANNTLENANADITKLQQNLQSFSNENAEQSEKLNQLSELKQELINLKETLAIRTSEVSDLKSLLSADDEAKKALQDKIVLLETAEKRLVTQFENTANKIFKEKVNTTYGTNGETGFGIGLFIVNNLLEKNGKSISYSNNIPKGTTAVGVPAQIKIAK